MNTLNLKLLDNKTIVVLDENGDEIDPYKSGGNIVVAGESNVTHIDVTLETPENYNGYTFKATLINALKYYEENEFTIDSGFDISDKMTYEGYTTIYITATDSTGTKIHRWMKYVLKIWSTSPNFTKPANSPLSPINSYDTFNDFPLEGEGGYLYVANDTGKSYRWSGSDYVLIPDNLALGETSTTAYPGNKGAYNRIKINENKREIQNLKSDIQGITGLTPAGVDTEVNILNYAVNNGIYVASDTGKWYYWTSEGYKQGGDYLANPSNVPSISGNNSFTGTNNFADLMVGGVDVADIDWVDYNFATKSTTAALEERLSSVETLIKPTYYFVESVDTFLTRETAEGQNIIDGSKAVIKSIAGHSEVCTNLSSLGTLSTANSVIGPIISGETYTFSCIFNNKESFNLKYDTVSGETITTDYHKLGYQSYTFTATQSGNLYLNGFIAEDGYSISEIMLNTGSTALPFEPYYEGIKSATATKITSVVGGGENLIENITAGSYHATYTRTDGEYDITCESVYQAGLYFVSASFRTNYHYYYISADVSVPNTALPVLFQKTPLYNTTANTYENQHIILQFNETKWSDGSGDVNITLYYRLNSSTTDTEFKMKNINVYDVTDYVNAGMTDDEIKNMIENHEYSISEFNIPAEIQALDGYGVEGNVVDFEAKTFTQNRATITLDGTEAWVLDAQTINRFYLEEPLWAGSNKDAVTSLMYSTFGIELSVPGGTQTTAYSYEISDAYGKLYISLDGTETLDEFKAKLVANPIILEYTLETPIVTDISDYIDDNTYTVWRNGLEKFDSDIAPTLDSTYFVSRIKEENQL